MPQVPGAGPSVVRDSSVVSRAIPPFGPVFAGQGSDRFGAPGVVALDSGCTTGTGVGGCWVRHERLTR